MATELKSLAFVPEEIFDGLGVISVNKFNYPADKLNEEFPFVTVSTEQNKGKLLTSAPTIATYRFNPQNVNPADYNFDFINRTVETRAVADATDLIKIVGEPVLNNGLLDVTVELKKDLLNETPDHAQENDIVALRAIEKDKKVNEYIVSDYAYVEATASYWGYRIIHKDFDKDHTVPCYYRNDKFVAITDPTDYNKGAGITVEGKLNPASVALNYEEEVDLLDYVATYCKTFDDANGEKKGGIVDELLNVEYEFFFAGLGEKNGKTVIVLNTDGTKALYESDTDEKTNQNAFVALNGSKIKVKSEYGISAVNRTPLVYVRAKANGKYLAEAFIKIEIIKGEVVVPPAEHWWDIFIIHDVDFAYEKLSATATFTGVAGTVEAPRKKIGPNANKDLNVTWTEVNQWVLNDTDVAMEYKDFGQIYDLDNPKIVLVKNKDGKLTQPGATLPDYNKATLVDFDNIHLYYTGVSGDKLSPQNWEQSTNIVNIKLSNSAPADGKNHYVYVVFQSKNGNKPDVILEFIYNVPELPAHEHQFTLFNWILNPDYLLNQNPFKPWNLNEEMPIVNAAADKTKYGVVRVKGQETANRSGIIEHFRDYGQKNAVVVNTESKYIFQIVNYPKDEVYFLVETGGAGTVGTVNYGTEVHSKVTLTADELKKVIDQDAGTPYVVLSDASRLQASKEILVRVTEVCNADDTKKADGFYYVVFEALKATINFNDIAFGTYKKCSDYALINEIVKNVVDESGNAILEWQNNAWTLVGSFADMTTATIDVAIDGLTYPYAPEDSEESFGGRLYTVDAGDQVGPGYTIGNFPVAGIEWWNLGTDLQKNKTFEANVSVKITVDGTKVTLATGKKKFTVLSTANSASKDPNHLPDGTFVPNPSGN